MAVHSFSAVEVEAFLDRIHASPKTRQQLQSPGGGSHALEALTALQRGTMIHAPFENTSLHYGRWQHFELDAVPLYEKVVQRGEGGACFQVSRLFMHMIRSLGYQCFPTGARINLSASANAAPGAQGSVFGEYSHMVLVVTIDGVRYLVDPCFGPNMPTSPVRLVEDQVQPDAPGRERRLVRSNIGQNTDKDQQYWMVQFRRAAAAAAGKQSGKWQDAYCFRPDEFLMADYEATHLSCRHGRRHWFMNKVMAFRWVDQDGDGVPAGWYIMWENQLRANWNGKVRLIKTLAGEADRVKALKEYFGVNIVQADVDHITGTVSYLRSLPAAEPIKSKSEEEKRWLHHVPSRHFEVSSKL